MTLNLSCHLEMLTLERAISIGTCGLAQSVRMWGGEGKEVVGCQLEEHHVRTKFQRWHCTRRENWAGQRGALLACGPAGRVPVMGCGCEVQDLSYLWDPMSLNWVCG